MEKFKACEKEMKTKAFSKEGLIQAAKMDPQQREKVETISWFQSKVEELQLQVETAEADIESLQGTVKKKSKSTPNTERLESLEHLNERRKWHISRLEIVLRLLDNGSLPIDKAISLKEDVAYFVESNTVRYSAVVRFLLREPVKVFWTSRTTNLMRMREYMMNSTSMKRKRNSVYIWKTMLQKTRTSRAKVSLM
jgi:hypothetical protein